MEVLNCSHPLDRRYPDSDGKEQCLSCQILSKPDLSFREHRPVTDEAIEKVRDQWEREHSVFTLNRS